MKVYQTGDGYKFYVQPSGIVTDTRSGKDVDMSFPSEKALLDALGDDIKLIEKPKNKAKGGMMNKPKKKQVVKKSNGVKVRGTGAAIRGTKFKGVF